MVLLALRKHAAAKEKRERAEGKIAEKEMAVMFERRNRNVPSAYIEVDIDEPNGVLSAVHVMPTATDVLRSASVLFRIIGREGDVYRLGASDTFPPMVRRRDSKTAVAFKTAGFQWGDVLRTGEVTYTPPVEDVHE